MFNFKNHKSINADEMVADSEKLMLDIEKNFLIKYSEKLDKLFVEQEVSSYEHLEQVAKVASAENHDSDAPNFDMVIISYNHGRYEANKDLTKAIQRMGGNIEDKWIPYISWSFPDDYDNPHWQHIFIFFVTPYDDNKVAEDYMAYFFNKYYQIEAFS